MIGMPELNQRTVDHLVRLAETDYEGRPQKAAWSTERTDARRWSAAVVLVRQHLGETLVGIGERLRGTPAGDAAASAPTT
jgi:hypothetical protein